VETRFQRPADNLAAECVQDDSEIAELLRQMHVGDVSHPELIEAGEQEVAYEAGRANLERYARSFQSVELLEAPSDYASSRYALPRPIKMVMASCGDANAAWVSSANRETLCYELADDFFDLYDGYTTNGKVQDQGLVSKNVARISLGHNAQAGSLDKLAMEMNGAANALFTKNTKLDNAKRHVAK
jgi:Putative metallopeptidase